jgi:hypothetical protein
VLAGVPAVTFGPPELAQLMQEAQATIAVAMLSSAGAGIVLGSIIACCSISREMAAGESYWAATGSLQQLCLFSG